MDLRRKSIGSNDDWESGTVSITMKYVTDEFAPENNSSENGFQMYPSEEDVLVRSKDLNDEILPRLVIKIKGCKGGQPAVQSQESSEEYEVEKIIRHRGPRRKRWYLIQWVGYDTPSWIRRSDFVTKEIVEEYEKGLQKKAGARRRSTGSHPEGLEELPMLNRSGFELGLTVDVVVGAARVSNAMAYVVRFNNGQEGIVSDTDLYTHAPEQAIEFLEQHLIIVGDKPSAKNADTDNSTLSSSDDGGPEPHERPHIDEDRIGISEVVVENLFQRNGKQIGDIDGFLSVKGSLITLTSTLKQNSYIIPFRMVLAHAPEVAAKYILSITRWTD